MNNIKKLNAYFGGADATLKAWTETREYDTMVNDANNSYLTKEEMYDLAMETAEKWEEKTLKRAHLRIVPLEDKGLTI